ncbi:uncharacterized protein BCR38DRAFT_398434 [Pseudomassariella vexata]|uniref:Glycoside hydrolase 131 catalytic N-terminal domain-containing protein n=1 Tax=Pseudomassariella vexata TaxID=1141098 RepID=A0A1Y2DM75_9PEZI|nr:uncharacterized protein BCR38DRAFT_398434 [Pseudomassariella vexata]ORY60236.1 hypothetical protein BCR38DRAFT_398434 [Pseudomassariella vexata]
MFSVALVFGLTATAASAGPLLTPRIDITCPIVLEGRVASSTALSDFDSYSTSIFNPDYVRGSQPWSQILVFSNTTNSRFENASYKSIEVTISDQSIFQSQNGFRRAGLQINGDTNTGGPGSKGVKTLHWSVKQDSSRPLNLTHEYLNVWHERADYNGNQFNFQTGTVIGQSYAKDTFKILDRQNVLVWSTPIDATAWQNFAVTLDFDKNTLQVYYSEGDAALAAVTNVLTNDNSGEGQYQFGILKKPTGTSDVVNSGYQEKGILEGQIYGGIFLEDSADGCISL